MSFFQLVETLNSLVIVANKRMNEKSVDCGNLVARYSGLNRIFLICLNNSDKVDNVLVVEVLNLDRLCAVLADDAGSFDNIVVIKEIKSSVILNVDNLNILNIICKRIDEVDSGKRILVSASLIKQSRLYAKLLVLIVSICRLDV